MSIIKEESSNDQLKQCRICLDNDHPDELISPCLCNGSSAYVHRKCLNDWRSENANGKGFKSCDICQFEYVIETVVTDRKEERKRLFKYYLFVFRDIGIDLNTNTGYSNRNRNSGSRWFTGIGIIVIIFAFIGIFVGIILSFIILRKIMKYHTQKLWLRQEAEKYIVKDFHGRRNELEKYKNILPIQSLTV
jgi:hypothetical protein